MSQSLSGRHYANSSGECARKDLEYFKLATSGYNLHKIEGILANKNFGNRGYCLQANLLGCTNMHSRVLMGQAISGLTHVHLLWAGLGL